MSFTSFPDIGNVERRSSPRAGQHGLQLTLRDGVPVLPAPTPMSNLRDAFKRGVDVTLSAIALVALAPVLGALAVAVRLSSSGPVLFRQRRFGRNGVEFTIYKFRTMRVDASDARGIRQVAANDAGLTAVGAFMRAKSLDELPQLYNVLCGDMSLVGPRPHPVGMRAAGVPYEELVPYYFARHAVRPGLSGWAQANGLRGPTTDAEAARSRIEHDVAYIQNQSTWLDVKIIALTIGREFLTGTGI